MKKYLALFLVALLTLATSAWPRAGGGVSVGRSSPVSVSRSTPISRPAPSYSAPATPSYKPAPTPAPTVTRNTTIVNNNGGGGGGAGSSFLGGLAGGAVGSMLGNAISHPSTTVIAPSGGAVAAPMAASGGGVVSAPAGTVVVESSSGWSSFWNFIGMVSVLLIFAAVIFLAARWVFAYTKKRQDQKDAEEDAKAIENEFDALDFFYAVQQAAMDDDVNALRKLCTPGMVRVLAGNPEPDKMAVKCLTGVTHQDHGDTIVYRFKDDGKPVEEHWRLHNGRLAGIEVQ